MASGKEVLAAIQKRQSSYDGAINTRSNVLQTKRQHAAGLREAERELIERIALQRLAAFADAEPLQALGETDSEVARLVAERARQQAELQQQLQQAEARQRQRDAEHETAAQAHEQAVAAAGEAVEAVLMMVRATPSQQALLQAEEQSELRRAAAQQELQRCADLLQVSTAQLESDPLASYLLQRGYGGEAYARRGPIAMLDRWVAGVCDFGGARLRQALAQAQHARARQAAELAEADIDTAVDAREAPEIAAVQASPAAALLEAEASASQHRASCLAALHSAEAEVAAIESSLDAIARNADRASQRALETLVAHLQGSDDASLHRAVADTRSTDDDQLAIELSQRRRELEILAAEVETLSGEIEHLRSELVTVKNVVREFPARGLDDAYSVFNSTTQVLDLLVKLQRGTLATDRFWESLKAQHRIQRPAPSSSSGWRSSSSRSSSFGGSSFRSGSGFKGGGFRSGKGF